MLTGLSEFWTRLVQSGICDVAGCKALALAFAKAKGSPPTDAQTLAKFLVKTGELTAFQAQSLLADQAIELQIGPFLIRSDQAPAPLSRWVEVTRIDGSPSADGEHGLLIRTTTGNAWLDAHAKVQFESLQSVVLEPLGEHVAVFSPLNGGRMLYEMMGGSSDATFDRRRSCEIGIAICNALSALQARSLVHGCVRADRVWITDEGRTILLRDPSGPPLVKIDKSTAGWLDSIDSAESYIAPELADGNEASHAGDIYSLGCLMFRLIAGRMPFVGGSIAETLQAHATESPPELVEALAQAESGDPLYRVLAYALAKNPAARFASADQFGRALKAISPAPKSNVDLPPIPPTSQGKPGSARPQNVVGPAEKSTPPKPKSPPNVDVESAPPRMTSDSAQQPVEAFSTNDLSRQAAPAARRRRKKKSKAPWVLGGLTLVVLLLMIALLVSDPNAPVAEKNKKRPPPPSVLPSVVPRPKTPTAIPTGNRPQPESDGLAKGGYEVVTADGLLFVPPYAADSQHSPLTLLPPGPAVIVTARLAAIRRSAIGNGIIDALSPELSGLIDTAVARAKVSADSLERCSVAMHPGSDGWPKVSLAIDLIEPRPLDELVELWQVTASRTKDGATIYAGEELQSDAYYILPGEVESQSVSRFAVGSVDQISDVASLEGGSIPLPRSMRTLWNGTSTEADLVVLITPNFLFADGRSMLGSFAPELTKPLKSLLIPDVAGALVTADIDGDRVFSEVRLAPSGGISEVLLMRKLAETIDTWPEWADQFIVDSVPDPSWRLLASRLPSMMRFVVNQFRYGISDQVVVGNAYLPGRAVPQVTLATLLAMSTPAGGETVASASPRPAKPLTIEEMLDRKMSVSFDQESLEFAIDAIVGEFKRNLPAGSTLPAVRIIGSDLQKMGITQNQQIRDFAKTDLPLRTVLTDLVLGANPDKSATGPKDPKQSLIWVVADDPENAGLKQILVTTRPAAENKYDVPQEFQLTQ